MTTAADGFDPVAGAEVVGDIGDEPVTLGELDAEDEVTGGEH